jgi:dolichol kinase
MERIVNLVRPGIRKNAVTDTFIGELIRKALHLLIALVPLMAAVDLRVTMAILASGTLFYVFAEKLRTEGRPVFIVSDLTLIASRERDRGRFVFGPVTLGVGTMLALILYPSSAAAIAIYALAFGDSLASLAGNLIRGIKLPLTQGKTLAGSMACFLVVLLSTYRITGSIRLALIIAAVAAVLEALPAGDFDNLFLPVGVGFAATLFQIS